MYCQITLSFAPNNKTLKFYKIKIWLVYSISNKGNIVKFMFHIRCGILTSTYFHPRSMRSRFKTSVVLAPPKNIYKYLQSFVTKLPESYLDSYKSGKFSHFNVKILKRWHQGIFLLCLLSKFCCEESLPPKIYIQFWPYE